MNKCILVGRLTKDCELRNATDKSVVSFTIAVSRPFKNKEGNYDTDFLNCVCWNNAENINKYLHKGSSCAVEGRVQTRTYDDKEGKKVYVTEIFCERVEFLDSKKDNSNEVGQADEVKEEVTNDFPDSGNIVLTDDDLPF